MSTTTKKKKKKKIIITRVEPAVPSSEHIAQDLLIGDAGRAHVAVKGIGL